MPGGEREGEKDNPTFAHFGHLSDGLQQLVQIHKIILDGLLLRLLGFQLRHTLAAAFHLMRDLLHEFLCLRAFLVL